MVRSNASVATINASKYLQQFCKHASHHSEVRFDQHSGHVDLGQGQSLELSADAEALHVSIIDSNASSLGTLETLFVDHIKRFAFRETLEFSWKRDEQAA